MPVIFSWSIEGSSSTTFTSTPAPGVQAGADAERDWALEPADGDIMISSVDGDAVFNKGAEGIASDLQSQFRMWLGEWYLDRQEGFPWLDVLGNQLDEAAFQRKVIEQADFVPGVVDIQNYALTRDNAERSFSVDFEAVCDTGEIISASIDVTQGA